MIVFLLGCEAEEATAVTEVNWAGFVYVGDGTDSEDRLSDGALSLTMADVTVDGEQPYDDYPGFWEFVVPPGLPVNLRIEGSGALPTVWAGDTPTQDANWLGGSVFAATPRYVEDLFEALGEDGDDWVLGSDNIDVLVIGVPSDPEWTCGEVSLDVAGSALVPSCWLANSEGEYTPVSGEAAAMVFAAVVPAGELVVRFRDAVEQYATQGGDVVLAYFFQDAPT